MYPVIKLFNTIEIGSYGLFVAVGAILAAQFCVKQYTKRGGNRADIIVCGAMCMVGAVIGMHIVYGLTNIPRWHELLEQNTPDQFIHKLTELFGGGVFYGGFIGAVVTAVGYARLIRMPVGITMDCIAPSVALFHVFGRIGCFMGGCCYGVESEYGIVLHNALDSAVSSVARLPVQLYEAAFELALFAVLWLLQHKRLLEGRLLFVYMIAYSVWRFAIEFLRGDTVRGFVFGISTSQFISIFVFCVGFFFLFHGRRDKRCEKVDV